MDKIPLDQLARTTARRHRSLQRDLLAAPRDGFDGFARTHAWTDRLIDELYGPETEEGEPAQNAYARFVRRAARAVEEAADQARGHLPNGGISTAEERGRWAEAACCIMAATRELFGRPDASRWADENDVRRWLLGLKACLELASGLRSGAGVDVAFNVLALDASAMIKKALDGALFGPALMGLATFERATDLLGARITELAANDLRCMPLVALWTSFAGWLYDERSGFLGRLRGFLSAVAADLARATLSIGRGAGLKAHDELAADLPVIDALLDVIDAMLTATSLFARCRFDGEADRAARQGRGPGSDRVGGRGENDRRRDTDERAADPRSFGFSGGQSNDSDGRLPNEGDTEHPIYGRGLFLTAGNARAFLQHAFGLSADEAARYDGRACGRELSEETASALRALGVF